MQDEAAAGSCVKGNAAIAALRDPALSMTQLMQTLEALEAPGDGRRVLKVGISSSVTVELLGTYLRKQAAIHGLRMEPVQGSYDDPVGDIQRFAGEGVEQVVLIPFLDNLMPSFEAQLPTLPAELAAAKEAEVQSRLSLALKAGQAFAAIYISTFHRMMPAVDPSAQDAVGACLARLNAMLQREATQHTNVRLVDAQQIIAGMGSGAALDARFYYRAKAPYSARYLDAFAATISDASRGFGSYFYKVLALDCDNTLWGGIIGEDGAEGIKLSPFDYPGNIFWRVQHEISWLEQNGVLLCLCTKNNPADVEEVFASHPDMVLKPVQIAARRVNWTDKARNLRELATELDIGLDSIVFLDDSEFECAAVRSQLPQVHTVQVPKNLPDYPAVLQRLGRLFLGGGVSAESRSKTQQYQQRAAAIAQQAEFRSQEDYLRSLNLQAFLTRNAHASVARIAELSQKSNQFNLTTQRYSAADISQRMNGPDADVYSLVVKDRFGDAGLTGVVVIHYEDQLARVDAFFMSCRVIGRGVEFSIWNHITAQAAARGCKELRASYVPSAKNALVQRFFDDLGMQRIATPDSTGVTNYRLALPATALVNRDWIEFVHA
ncbi:MAG: FkbH protein [Polaromonas sp.]|nr:FkbH protein [Polaromonas sp.]